MCGRYVRKSSPAALVDRFHAELRGVDPDASPEYNVAPRTFCARARAAGYSAIRKRLALGAWRQAC